MSAFPNSRSGTTIGGRPKKGIEKLQPYINIIVAVATVLTLFVMYSTLTEMNKQRLSAYIPYLELVPAQYKVEYDKDMSDKFDEEIYPIPDPLPEIQIRNLGKGVARDLRIEWDTTEFDKLVYEYGDWFDRCFVIFGSTGYIRFKDINKGMAVAYFEKNKEEYKEYYEEDEDIDDEYKEYYGMNLRDRVNFVCEKTGYIGAPCEDGYYYEHDSIFLDYVFEQSIDESVYHIDIPFEIIGGIYLLSGCEYSLVPEDMPKIYIKVTFYDIFGTQYTTRFTMNIDYDNFGDEYCAFLSYEMN